MTYHCLFGLLSVTGLRVSEAQNLELQDVDLRAGVLTIRGAKFGKSRLVPLHASTRRESKRCAGGKVVQRQVLYLGEINDGQRESWSRVIEAFDEGTQRRTKLAMFSADRAVPDHAHLDAAMSVSGARARLAKYGLWFNAQQPEAQLPEDDIVHLIVDAVGLMDLSGFEATFIVMVCDNCM